MANTDLYPFERDEEHAAACDGHLADLIAVHEKPPLDVRVPTGNPRFMPIPPARSGCGSPAFMCVNILE
jgi:hypothetical protein